MEIINAILHVVVGCILAYAILWLDWLAIPVMLFIGLMREQAQHRKDGLLGWITGHRLFEAAQWGIGGLAACLIWFFVNQ